MKKERLVKLLKELLRNSRRSDRELAKATGASQPTVTRNRRKLAKYIRSYTIVPEFSKIGYEILAITFAKAKVCSKKEAEDKVERARKWTAQHSSIIFACDGEGLGKDTVIVSLHRDYSKYASFMREYSVNFADSIGDVQSFVTSLTTGMITKPFDLKYLADDMDNNISIAE